jgi:hypothetical protein
MFQFAHPDTLPDLAQLEPLESTLPCAHGNYMIGYYLFEESEAEIGLVRNWVTVNVN